MSEIGIKGTRNGVFALTSSASLKTENKIAVRAGDGSFQQEEEEMMDNKNKNKEMGREGEFV